ncbi:hypothetical protein ASG48_07275 [Aurantimonas sp. Leaf443]|nr:hypothetical protein ASG48_07275 [Aurantimonas sp. Leaf443]
MAEERSSRLRFLWASDRTTVQTGTGRHHANPINLSVHGARGLFAMAVYVYHISNSGLPVWDMPHFVAEFFHSLKFGVELFFAISGYVIAGTLARARSPGHFILNRATRIFPVLWVAVLCIVAMSLVSGRELPATLDPASLGLLTVANLLALPGIFPLPLFHPAAWTLSFELVFYVLCFVHLLALRRWKANLLLPAFAVGLVLVFFFPRGLFFISGVIVASASLKGLPSALTRFAGLWLALFLFSWMLVANPDQPFFTTMGDWIGTAKPFWALVAFAAATLMLEGISRGEGWLAGVLRTKPMLWLGTISYSLYLWHVIVLGVVKALMYATGIPTLVGPWSQLAFLAISIVPTLVLSHLSQIVLEQGATNLLRARFKA